MNRQEISEKVRIKVSEKLKVPIEQCTVGTTLYGLGADSLDMVELIIDFECMFKIKITDLEGERIQTSKDFVDLIERKLN